MRRIGALTVRARAIQGFAILAAMLTIGGSARAALFEVNSTADAGDNSIGDGDCWTGGFIFIGQFGIFECTLRAAIQEANATVAIDTIGFFVSPDGTGVVRIQPVSALPVVSESVVIDGTGNPGYPAGPWPTPVVIVDGLFSPTSADGLVFSSGADVSIVRGLSVVGWRFGLHVNGADGMLIQSSHFGLERGSVVRANTIGIEIASSSFGTVIGQTFSPASGFLGEGNVLTGNSSEGIRIRGDDTFVVGNRIGTNPGGNVVAGLGNLGEGIDVYSTADGVDIGRILPMDGGLSVASGNTIAGNASGGILVRLGSSNVSIVANHVGIGADGSTALGNGAHPGIELLGSGASIEFGNVVSGNATDGIMVGDRNENTVTGNRIAGNLVGVDASGSVAVPNAGHGVNVENGDLTDVVGNTIGGNGESGIYLQSEENEVHGNWIGTNVSFADLGNDEHGIQVDGPHNEIELGNHIGFNGFRGIDLATTAEETMINGNYIGCTAAGGAIGNGFDGIGLRSDGNVVQQNRICDNVNYGMAIFAGATRNVATGNFIGTEDLGGTALGNTVGGIQLASASGNRIGGNSTANAAILAAARNVIAHNQGPGIDALSGDGNALRGNHFSFNEGLAIDLSPSGPSPNDPTDLDIGANLQQNSPLLIQADTGYDPGTGIIDVRYQVDSDPIHSSYPLVVDFHVVGSDGLEPGEWIGSDNYLSSDAASLVDFAFFPEVPVSAADKIVAIATDAANNTSETSNVVALPEPGLPTTLATGLTLVALVARRRRRALGATSRSMRSTESALRVMADRWPYQLYSGAWKRR